MIIIIIYLKLSSQHQLISYRRGEGFGLIIDEMFPRVINTLIIGTKMKERWLGPIG